MSTFALLAAGGTGGHVYPAIALARELVARTHPAESVRFVGGRRGLEVTAVPEAGFALDRLPGRGLRRRVTLENALAAVEAVVALALAVGLILRHRPRVVVGFGGYASLPCVVAARALRVPAVVHEQNAAPGLANRIAVRLGARAAVSVPGTPLDGAITTGNPVRPDVATVTRARQTDPVLVAVVGGSLGALTLNRSALALYDRWRDRTDVAVRHVAGPRDHADCAAHLAALRRPTDRLRYDLVEYEHDMASLYARAAVVVARAGATTVAELAITGTPSVLVPLPGAPGSHQAANAAHLERRGAAVIVPDETCDGETLDRVLTGLIGDGARLEAMGKAAAASGEPGAAGRLADLVEEAAGE